MVEEKESDRNDTQELIDLFRKPMAMKVSYTRLDTYKTCPKKYKFIYLQGRRQAPSEKMLVGQAVHTTLETWVADEGKDLGDLMDIFTASCMTWRADGDISDEEEHLAREMLIDYFELLKSLDKKTVIDVEYPFEFYTDNACVTGVIDRVQKLDGNILKIVDYKSGRSSISQKQAPKNLQMAIYTMAAKEIWEADRYITELVYPRLKKSVIHEFTEEELAIQREDIRNTITEIRLDKKFKPMGTPPICGNCSFKFECGWGKKQDRIWQGILRKRGK